MRTSALPAVSPTRRRAAVLSVNTPQQKRSSLLLHTDLPAEWSARRRLLGSPPLDVMDASAEDDRLSLSSSGSPAALKETLAVLRMSVRSSFLQAKEKSPLSPTDVRSKFTFKRDKSGTQPTPSPGEYRYGRHRGERKRSHSFRRVFTGRNVGRPCDSI